MALIQSTVTDDLSKRNRVDFADSRLEKIMQLAKLRNEDWRYLVYKAVDRYLDDHLYSQKSQVQIGS